VTSTKEAFENLRLELRRGSLILAAMAALRKEQYGYGLRKSLADLGIVIDENTLYPLLRRLESQRLLKSEWREEDRRKKRFYKLSSQGAEVLAELLNEWRGINQALERVVNHHDSEKSAWT
jgi:PadR family transcriptional regulator PadR